MADAQKHSAEKSLTESGSFFKRHWVVFSIIGTILVASGALIIWFYHLGFDNGMAKSNTDCRYCDIRLSLMVRDSATLNKRNKTLEDSLTLLKYALNIIAHMKENNGVSDGVDVGSRNTTKQITSYNQKLIEQKPKVLYAERDAFAEARLTRVEKENEKLLAENDELRSKMSSMWNKLKRARGYERSRKEAKNVSDRAYDEKMRDEEMSKLEAEMTQLFPELIITQSNNPQPKTQTVTVTVQDYEKLGDNDYENASIQERILRAEPDRILWKKNKTKLNLVMQTLSMYQSALKYYIQANATTSVQKANDKMEAFKRDFHITEK